MTDEELQAIEARSAAATPGPWHVVPCCETHAAIGGYATIKAVVDVAVDLCAEDAQFVIHARNHDVPVLIAEVRRLRAELERFENEDHA